MDALLCYKTMPVWHAETIPEGFRRVHNTKAGTWAELTILRGSLEFALTDADGTTLETLHCSVENQPPRIAPQQWHRIASTSADLECQLAFLCEPADYFAKKHRLTSTHSEVLEAVRRLPPLKHALDLGCGKGRNTLYLRQKGCRVDAWDNNAESLSQLRAILAAEEMDGVDVRQVDLNHAAIAGQYDFILSTVVMMFLQPEGVARLIANMQQATEPGGYNLIVAAMNTPDCPCPVPFPFTFGQEELAGLYDTWDILKYNEDLGELHRTDAEGKRIRLRFATLLAGKPLHVSGASHS